MRRKGGVGVSWLSKVFKELVNLTLPVLDFEDRFYFVFLQLGELRVEVLLDLEHDLADHLNLETLTFVSVKFEGVVKQVVDVQLRLRLANLLLELVKLAF